MFTDEHRDWEQSLTDKGYPAERGALPTSPPREAKALQTVSPQPAVPANFTWLGATEQKTKQNDEKIEEKEKSNEEIIKSSTKLSYASSKSVLNEFHLPENAKIAPEKHCLCHGKCPLLRPNYIHKILLSQKKLFQLVTLR